MTLQEKMVRKIIATANKRTDKRIKGFEGYSEDQVRNKLKRRWK